METVIDVALPGREYPIIIASGLFKTKRCDLLKNILQDRRCLIVSDNNVGKIYGDAAAAICEAAGASAVHRCELPAGEASKNLDGMRELYSEAIKAGLDRKSMIVALGHERFPGSKFYARN